MSVNEDEATAREVAQVIRQVDEGGVVERGVGILSDICLIRKVYQAVNICKGYVSCFFRHMA